MTTESPVICIDNHENSEQVIDHQSSEQVSDHENADDHDHENSEHALLIPKPVENDTEKVAIKKNVIDGKFKRLSDMLGTEYLGIYLNYIIVAIFYGSLNSMNYPVFKNLLGMKSYQIKGASSVIRIWWSFKMFIGAITDSYPIFGYRRKPYIVGGWVATIFFTLVTIHLGNPKPGESDGYLWILCFSAMQLSFLFSGVAMDGMVTDLAQKEPIETRGTLQSNVYMIRFATSSIVGAVMSFTFNSKEYGGKFSWGFTITQYLSIIVIFPIIAMYPMMQIEETGEAKRKSFCTEFSRLYKRIQLNAVWRVILCTFLLNFFLNISNAASFDVERQWCKVEPLLDGLFGNVLGHFFSAVAIYITKTYWLNVSWRRILSLSICFMIVFSYIPSLLIDLGIVRSPYFYIGAPLVTTFSYGIFHISSVYCIVEIAESGSEAIMYGLIASIHNLSRPLSNLFSANLTSLFDLHDHHGHLKDDIATRHSMALLDTTVVLINLCALPMLLILPPQKKEIQDLLKSGASNKLIRFIIVVSLTILLTWAVSGNIMEIFPQTACLRIVGGKGCSKAK